MIEYVIAELLKDYLSTEASQEEGVPEIPIRLMDEGLEAVTPRLSIAATRTESNSHRATVEASINLHALLGAERGQTTRAQAAEWMDSIEARLADQTAWLEWLADLSEERRTGYQILRRVRTTPDAIDRERDGDIVLRSALTFFLRV